MSDQIKQVLIDTKALLQTKGWTQGEVARNSKGKRTDLDSPKAVCFCLAGAIERVALDMSPLNYHDLQWDAKQIIRSLIRKSDPGLLIPEWNDAPGRMKEEVIALLDTAIEIESQS